MDGTSPEEPSGSGQQHNGRGGSADIWLYPKEFDNELQGVAELPAETVAQVRAVAWEYTRSVIPSYTNWDRYLAFCRVIIVGIVAEFQGALVDVAGAGPVLGYDLDALFDALFAGTAAGHRDAMARDFRTFALTTAEKTSRRQHSELFRRYADALAEGPAHWFRIRDADALVRFSLAAALACNGVTDFWFAEPQLQVLAEVGCTLYDAVAFYKHRAEGETNDTFAYVDPPLRADAFRRAREVLWALDAAWAAGHGDRRRRLLPVVNFLRPFGGPIQMMMRRYRFVEEGLAIGRPETEEVVAQTRRNVKLWNRVDLRAEDRDDGASYRDAIRQEGRVLFEGLAELLELQEEGRERCGDCRYRTSYGAENMGQFGGVELCEGCRERWADYLRSLPRRAAEAFPELRSTQLLASWADKASL